MPNHSTSRTGAVCAIAGAALLMVGTYLHPMQADPNHAAAAFAEYAADHLWVASHLMQLAGVALMVTALLLLAQQLALKGSSNAIRIAAAGAVASLALAAVLQAVDGIALKNMVDAWTVAPPSQKDGLFLASFAVRQLEIGLASMFCLVMGVTATAFGLALLDDISYPRWFAGMAIVGGLATAIAGVVIAYTGFSALAMAINMPANLLLVFWIAALGAFMWRGKAAQ